MIFSDDQYFPDYVSMPVDYWLHVCDRFRTDVEMYSDNFLQTFEDSNFFEECKKTVEGKMLWKEWSDCSVSCGGGYQTQIAAACVPDYAVCYGIQIFERSCNDLACPIGQWTWNEWSDCSSSCDGGLRFKTAQSCEPLGAECKDVPVLTESCYTEGCPNGEWTWNDWGECSHSCGSGIRIKTADECLPKGAVCDEAPIKEEPCNENACPEGQWIWNDWGKCNSSCGGGIRIRTVRECVPEGASCDGAQVKEEPCNEDECPEVSSSYLPVGTIISWVPRPNKNFHNNFYFGDDAWVECDGIQTCTKGKFAGEVCSDLTDRVLVGAGKTGSLLEVKDASLPDHAHSHKHTGTKSYTLSYRTGPKNLDTGKQYMGGSGSLSYKHGHDEYVNMSFTVDFSQMSTSEAFISKITNPKVSKSTSENELYSPHMRVKFMFKCH